MNSISLMVFELRLNSVLCRPDADNQLRTACYEVLNSFVANVGQDELPSIAQLCTVIMERLEKTVALRTQIVSTDDRITLEEMQTSLAVVLMVCNSRQFQIFQILSMLIWGNRP